MSGFKTTIILIELSVVNEYISFCSISIFFPQKTQVKGDLGYLVDSYPANNYMATSQQPTLLTMRVEVGFEK